MKNEKIINALNKIESSDEIKNEIFNEIIQKQNVTRPIIKSSKIIAIAAAIVLTVGLINIQTVIAFVRGLLFVPGVGMTDEDISVHMLNEPVEIECDWGKITLEFVTKLKHEDGKCEILLYLTTRDKEFLSKVEELISNGNTDGTNYTRQELSATALINGEIYVLDNDSYGGGNAYGNGYIGYFNMTNNDFPDIDEFDLRFRDTTTHIVLTELSDDEKIPYKSKEIHGITLIAYKYRNNNRLISVDVMNSNDLGEFYTGTPNIFFNTVTGEQDTMLQVIGESNYSFIGWVANKGHGFGYYIKQLDNESNMRLTEIKNIDLPGIMVEYYTTLVRGDGDLTTTTTKPQLTLPIPKDGEIIKTDIKILVGGTFYEVTEVRREGDILYYTDNSVGYDETFDMDSAIKNNEIHIVAMSPMLPIGTGMTFEYDHNTITWFNPSDDFIDINIRSIQVVYFGDFSVDLTQK